MDVGAWVAHRYRLDARLGRGGLGTTFRAHDSLHDVDVALKLVRGSRARLDRLRGEFVAVRGAQHPRLVRARDFGFASVPGAHGATRAGFYTADLVDGVTLDVFASGRRFEAVARALAHVLGALAFLHRRGWVHGDVHPENVMVTASGDGVLLDLSCASPAGTAATEVSGRPGFLAPERLEGVVGRGADLFALGRTLASLDLRGGLPAPVARVVDDLVEASAARRPASVEDLADRLGWSLEPATGAALRGAFVGREREVDALRAAIDAARSGADAPRVLRFAGEPGVGRSRLVEELKVLAQLEVPVVVEGAGRRPGTVRRLLAAAGHDPGEGGPLAIAEAAIALARGPSPAVLFVDDADGPEPGRAELAALARSLPRDGAAVLVAASNEPLASAGDELAIRLEPLTPSAVRAWLADEVPTSAIEEIVRATGGYPSEIAALVVQVEAAGWGSRALARAAAAAASEGGWTAPVDPDERRALALLAAGGGGLGRDLVRTLGADAAARRLAARGLVRDEPAGFRTLRASDALRIAESFPDDVRAAHAALAPLLAAEPERAIVHLAGAGEAARACDALSAAVAVRPASGLGAAAEAVAALGDAEATAEALLGAAAVRAEVGDARGALGLVARLLRRRPSAALRARASRVAGGCYAKLGDAERALRALRRARRDAGTREEAAAAAADLSLALLKRGDHVEARDVAADAFARGGDLGATGVDLACNAAFAESYRGDTVAAEAWLGRARSAADALDPPEPRRAFRLHNAAGFVAYRAGETGAALTDYAEALRIAEREGLDDLVPSAALNLGTAAHQTGDLGRAIEAYGRGLRAARALGMPTTELMLEFNLAKAWLDVGQLARARTQADAVCARAPALDMTFLGAAAESVLGAACIEAGDREAGRSALARADAAFTSVGARREALEVALELGELALAERGAAAEIELDALERAAAALGAADLRARALLLAGGVALARGRAADAVDALERAMGLAERSSQRLLAAEAGARLSDAFEATGASALARERRLAARGLVERTLATLPDDLRDTLRRRARWARLFADDDAGAPAPAAGARGLDARDLERLLEINRRLNSAATTEALLEEAMDAAVELTRAERGFLLVRERGDALRVAVARNLDRERLRAGHLKFSRTIAERVVRSGEPVVAVDAASDARFARARSVHALGLKSVLCVPVRAPEGVLGAIYVDQRFRAGTFEGHRAELLSALAEQAAIALARARLVDELTRKTAELEAKNAEIERLAGEQAREIVRLHETLSSKRAPARAAGRLDRQGLVATSPAMRRVLHVLERVVDADVTVLLRGESGTGKERVARALHEAGPRARRPFVAVNCGALPESLLEAELFGYRKGAFSGAVRDHDGLFVAAQGGTLLLDELGEMPLAMQVKLLRALQEREVRPLGSNETVAVDVRVVAATNRDLAADVRSGRFREDLYYRVAVVDVVLPPLRERLEDVLPLAEEILGRLATQLGRPRTLLDRSAERALLAHPFPGNVRELENALTKAFYLAQGPSLAAADLELGGAARTAPTAGRRRVGRDRLVATLERTDWNVTEAARALSIPRATFYRMMGRLGLRRGELS